MTNLQSLNFFIPEIYLNKKIKSPLLNNKFYFFQKFSPGLTLSGLIQKNKIKINKAKNISKILVDQLTDIAKEDLKNSVNYTWLTAITTKED